jgi:hypothetical protein
MALICVSILININLNGTVYLHTIYTNITNISASCCLWLNKYIVLSVQNMHTIFSVSEQVKKRDIGMQSSCSSLLHVFEIRCWRSEHPRTRLCKLIVELSAVEQNIKLNVPCHFLYIQTYYIKEI